MDEPQLGAVEGIFLCTVEKQVVRLVVVILRDVMVQVLRGVVAYLALRLQGEDSEGARERCRQNVRSHHSFH